MQAFKTFKRKKLPSEDHGALSMNEAPKRADEDFSVSKLPRKSGPSLHLKIPMDGILFCSESLDEKSSEELSASTVEIPRFTFNENVSSTTSDAPFSANKSEKVKTCAKQEPVHSTRKGLSAEKAKIQRLHTLLSLLQRYRSQEKRGDFANNKEAALRSSPSAWRQVVVEWLQMITIKKSILRPATVAYAVSLLDSYISKCPNEDVPTTPRAYQLCAVTAFTIACKFCQRMHVAARVTLDFACGRFSVQKIAAMERRFIEVLEWKLYPVCIHDLATLLLQEVTHILIQGQNCSDRIKHLEGIVTVLLDLQLSNPKLLSSSRSTMALGIVRAACEICKIDFDQILSTTIEQIFLPEEIEQQEETSRTCQQYFYDTFPDVFCRPNSPSGVTDIASLQK